MDDIALQLKRDAARIRAEVSPELQRRIDASLRAASPALVRPARRVFSFPLWLAASATGAAAAGLVLFLVGRDPGSRDPVAAPPDDAVARTVPEYAPRLEREFPLEVETAELTAPLEEELANLKSDLEKARGDVKEDLESTF